MLHGASSGVWNLHLLAFWALTIRVTIIHVLIRCSCRGIRCCSYQRRANSIHQHSLAIQIEFEWLSFVNDFINSLAQVFWLKMSTSFRALILLTIILFGVNALIIIEVNVFTIIMILFHLLLSIISFFLIFVLSTNDIVLVVRVVRQLVQIVLILMLLLLLVHRLLVLLISVLLGSHEGLVLFRVNPSSIVIHFFLFN